MKPSSWPAPPGPPIPARPPRPTSLRLIAVGRLRPGPEAELFARYTARLRPTLAVTEIAEAPGPPPEAKRRENAALRAALSPRAHVVALDPGGRMPDSAGFAALLATWQSQQPTLCFLIGGAEGLDEATIAACAASISLGSMTWPHLLCRVLLAEQLYRAQSILAGHPYHRSGRPETTTPAQRTKT